MPNCSFNSNWEIEGTSNDDDLTIHGAGSKFILRKQQSKQSIPRPSQMSAGAPAKMLAYNQFKLKNDRKV